MPGDTHVVYAINEGIIAAVAHGKPVTAEPYDANEVIVVDFRYSHVQNVIQLQGQPAKAKDDHNDN